MGMYTELIFGASIKKDAPKRSNKHTSLFGKWQKLYEEVEIEKV